MHQNALKYKIKLISKFVTIWYALVGTSMHQNAPGV